MKPGFHFWSEFQWWSFTLGLTYHRMKPHEFVPYNVYGLAVKLGFWTLCFFYNQKP